jgi:hypothetical protein
MNCKLHPKSVSTQAENSLNGLRLVDHTHLSNYVVLVTFTKTEQITMARKSKDGINVSAAVREYLKANKDVGPTAAAEAVSKQIGKKVTSTYVSNIKTIMNAAPKKKGRKGRKLGRKPGSVAVVARAHSNGSVELATISAVKDLLGRVSADTAKQLIDLLA